MRRRDTPRRAEHARRHRQYWTPTEVRRFLAVRGPDPLGAIWRLALDTGIRRVELSELTWPDIDLENRTVTIRDPRTRRTRIVQIGEATAAALHALATKQLTEQTEAGDAWMGSTPGSTGYVVVSRVGQRYPPVYLTRAFMRAQGGLGLPRIPFHCLRHTSVRIAFAGGASVQVVTRRLGHLDATTTLEVYPHVLFGDDDRHDDREGPR